MVLQLSLYMMFLSSELVQGRDVKLYVLAILELFVRSS